MDTDELKFPDFHRESLKTDPTALTTQQLIRSLAALRELLETRMDGTDRIINLMQKEHEQMKTVIKEDVGHLKTLNDERFNSIHLQFNERDTRTEQTSKDGKVAVDAALQAAKEAVGEQNKSNSLAIGKSEAAATKQMDQINLTIQTTSANLNDKIDDVKARLLTAEGLTKGAKDMKDDNKSIIALIVSVLSVIFAIGFGLYEVSKAPAQTTLPQIIYVPTITKDAK
jgi:hypothetical protein